MKNDPLLTPVARRHLNQMLRAIAPLANRLDRQFGKLLRGRAYNAAQIRALLAVTPAAASRVGSLHRFLEHVEYNGRRLAKLNLPPGEVRDALAEFGDLVTAGLAGRFAPAREQLDLATTLALHQAFYQVREAESQAFFGLYHAETEAVDLDDLLGRLVRILTQTFRARSGRLLLLPQPATGKLARPLYIERGRPDEKLIACPEMRGCHASYWSFPLRSAGLLQLAFAVPYPWLPRELALLHAVAERCHEAIERARIQGELRRLDAVARHAEEEERRRIGRELHDEAGQTLLLLRLQLEMMERDAPPALRARLSEARANTERTVEGLRRTIAALSPALLERLGLEPALRQLAARFRKLHSAQVRLTVPVPFAPVSRQIQEVLYRVAQESLQNIAKHSQATHVNLSLQSSDKSIKLTVTDDGAGFSTKTAAGKPMSFGLAGMRERALLLGGSLVVRSAPGKGASIVLVLPSKFPTGDKECQKSKFS